MKKKYEKIKRPLILKVIGILQGISILPFIFSPVIFIWFTWTLTWKIGLSSIFCAFVLNFIYNVTHKIYKSILDAENLKSELKD